MNGDIQVRLNLDGRDFELGIYRADRLIRNLGRSTANLDRRLRSNQNVLRAWSRRLRDISVTLGSLPFAIQALTGAIDSSVGSIIRANAKMERMNQLMVGLSSESTTLAEAQKDAADQMAYLLSMVDKSPFNLDALSNSMVKLRTIGLDPTAGSLQAIVDSVAEVGGTSVQLARASVAIQQMAGKGVVSMEELRQQLGEAVPDAINLMARGLGVTMASLVKKVSTGVVEANTALSAMFNQMALENDGAAKAMSRTWDGLIGRLSAKWLLFKAHIGDQGAFSSIKKSLEDILDFMDDPAFQDFGQDIGVALNNMVTGLKALSQFMYENSEVVALAAKALVVYGLASSNLLRQIGVAGGAGLVGAMTRASAAANSHRQSTFRLTQNLQDATAAHQRYVAMSSFSTGAFRNYTSAANVAAAQTALANNRLTSMTSISNGARYAVAGLGTATAATGRAIYGALGPIGLFVGSLWAVYEVLGAVNEKKRIHNALIDGTSRAYSRKQLQKENEAIQDQVELIDSLISQRKASASQGGVHNQLNSKTAAYLGKSVREAQKKLKAMQANFAANSSEIATRLASSAIKGDQYKIEKAAAELTRKFNQEVLKIERSRKAGGNSTTLDAANNDLIAKHKARLIALHAPVVSAARAELTSLEIQRANAEKMGKIANIDEDLAYQKAKQRLEFSEAAVKKIQALTGLTQMKELSAAGSKSSPLERQLARSNAMLLTAKARIAGTSVELAKFNQRVKDGAYKNATEEQINLIRSRLKASHALNNSFKVQKTEVKGLASIYKTLSNQTGRIAAESLKLTAEGNPWLKISTGMNSLNKTLAQSEQKIKAMGLSAGQYAVAMERVKVISQDAIGQQQMLDAANAIQKMEAETKKLTRGLLTQKQSIKAAHAETVAWLDEWYQKATVAGAITDQQTEAFKRYKDALKRNVEKSTQSATTAMLKDWGNKSKAMDQVWKTSMQGMSDSLTNFVMTGKLSMGNFLKTITSMIVKAQINKLLSGAFSGGGGGAGSGLIGTLAGIAGSFFGASAAPGSLVAASPGIPANMGTSFSVSPFANGGIMTEYGKAPLRKYATGGIANSPQVALYGEGSVPEAYVPLPDGQTIPVTLSGGQGQGSSQGSGDVEINIINQSDKEVQSASTEKRMDGEKMILDIVLKASTKSGAFRSGMRGAMA